MELLGFHRADFYETWYLRIFRKHVEKIQVWFKSNKNGYFTWRHMYIYDNTSLKSSWSEKFFRQIRRENQYTHFVFSNFCFRKSCSLWDNVEKCGTARQATDDNIIRRMRCACWITEHTLRICNTGFPWQKLLRERDSVLCYIRNLPVLLCFSVSSYVFRLPLAIFVELINRKESSCSCRNLTSSCVI
jgi:hypothetical protein